MAHQIHSQRETDVGDTNQTSHDSHSVHMRRTPNWFSEPASRAAQEDAAERYRAMRGQVLRSRAGPESGRPFLLDLEIKRSFGIGNEEKADVPRPQQRAPMAPPRKMLMARPAAQAEPLFEQEIRTHRKLHRKVKTPARSISRSAVPIKYIGAGCAAILAGVLLGYGATHYKAIGAKAGEIASLIRPAETASEQDALTVVAKKSVATATLDVADVSGELNSMIPLMLHAEPADDGHDLILKLSGLPPSAYLTAGTKAADNAWQLAAADAAGVKLVVPQTSESSFDVAVAAFEAKTGELAAPIKEMTVAIDNPTLRIAPAAALPDKVVVKTTQVPDALPSPEEPQHDEQQVAAIEPPGEAQNLLAKGDILLKSGDMAMARQFYERAFEQGSTEAAMGAGKTYDPAVYAELKVHGLKPDPIRAMEWYMKASAAGHGDAAAAIEALKQAAP